MSNQSSTPNDASTVLNAGVGGDVMSESAPVRVDGAVRKIARVVQVGDADANAIIDPISRRPRGDEYAAPSREMDAHEILNELRAHTRLLTQIAFQLSILTEVEPEVGSDDSSE